MWTKHCLLRLFHNTIQEALDMQALLRTRHLLLQVCIRCIFDGSKSSQTTGLRSPFPLTESLPLFQRTRRESNKGPFRWSRYQSDDDPLELIVVGTCLEATNSCHNQSNWGEAAIRYESTIQQPDIVPLELIVVGT